MEDAKTLLKHQAWDHEIILKSGKELTYEPLKWFSKAKHAVQNKYIEINL